MKESRALKKIKSEILNNADNFINTIFLVNSVMNKKENLQKKEREIIKNFVDYYDFNNQDIHILNEYEVDIMEFLYIDIMPEVQILFRKKIGGCKK